MTKICRPMIRLLAILLLVAVPALHSQGQTSKDRIVDSQNEAAFRLYQAIKSTQPEAKSENFIFSPSCAAHAMSLVYAGAKEETADQIAAAMGFPKEIDLLARTFRALNSPSLQTATGAWVSSQVKLSDDYMKTVRVTFHSDVSTVDFTSNNTVPSVNKWFEQKTKGKIPRFVDSFDPGTKLFLGSAIHFKADWKYPFEHEDTRPRSFTTWEGNVQRTPMMYQNSRREIAYAEYDDCQMIEMEYKNFNQSMIVILPQKSVKLEDVEKHAYELLGKYISQKKTFPEELKIYLPKFETKAKIELLKALQSMGIKNAFSSTDADFSGMTGNRELYVSRVFHEATINLDEKGTEASAATGVAMMAMSMVSDEEPEPKIFCADRPFLYVIKDNRSDLILFIGSFVKPETKNASLLDIQQIEDEYEDETIEILSPSVIEEDSQDD